MLTTPADRVRSHLEHLSANGVGLDTVAARSGVNRSTLSRIKAGRATTRTATEAAVLAVTTEDVADRALLDAQRTNEQIRDLIAHGWTKTQIAEHAGLSRLRIGNKVTARTAAAIEALHRTRRRPPHKTPARPANWDRTLAALRATIATKTA